LERGGTSGLSPSFSRIPVSFSPFLRGRSRGGLVDRKKK